MSRTYRDLKTWSSTLEAEARTLLSGALPASAGKDCAIVVEACPEHGPSCARVVYGMLREHIDWTREEPVALAGRLVGTMLPPAPENE
jgi:hypothetical protein